jgi:hypothetical protein
MSNFLACAHPCKGTGFTSDGDNHTADYVMANKAKFWWNLTGKVLEVVNTVLRNMLLPYSTLKRDAARFSETSICPYMVS